MENLYKQAIVDAKAVRASAIANAKATLQESIEPQIQKMMRMKLAEDLDEEYDEVNEDEMSDDTIDEASLDEILDELNSLEEDDAAAELEESIDELEEDEDSEESDDESDDDNAEEDDSEESEDDSEEAEESEEVNDDTKVIEMTFGDLKKALQKLKDAEEDSIEDISADDMAIDDMEMEPNAMGAEGGEEDIDLNNEESFEETLSLDEVLAELEKEELEEKEKVEKMEEKKNEELEEEKEEDLEEKVHKMEDELEEAQDAIITLNETLKELNLLNAKLLFANKILRAKNLSESEKSRVIRAFDRTKTVKETKNTYNTLMESFTKKPKTQIKESIGFASKPTGVASKTSNPIVESDGFIDRWKVIAGIK